MFCAQKKRGACGRVFMWIGIVTSAAAFAILITKLIRYAAAELRSRGFLEDDYFDEDYDDIFDGDDDTVIFDEDGKLVQKDGEPVNAS